MSSFVSSVSLLRPEAFAISFSSSEISTFIETATYKAVSNPGRAITVVSDIGYRFLSKPSENIPPYLSILSGTIRVTIHDVVTDYKVTADFSTSKFIIAECSVMEFKSNLNVKVITLPGF